MTTLKDLLDDLEIEPKEDELNLKDVKIEDIPEEHRPIFEKAMGIIEEQTNELSRRDLMIDTLKSVKPVVKEPEEEEETDPVQMKFKALEAEIATLKSGKVVDEQKEFETNLKEFASKNKDIVRYAKDMDQLLVEHPTLTRDIPKLYALAKSINERRENLVSDKKDELSPRRNVTESSGMPTANVGNATQGKTIGEAFDLAEKNLNRR